MALKSTSKYYHLNLEVHQDCGRWSARLRDPHKYQTLTDHNKQSSKEAAEQIALAAAQGYLLKEYPDQKWPVIQTRWVIKYEGEPKTF